MKRILFLFLLLALTGIASAQSNPPLTVQEVDGSPKKTGISKIVVTNGTLSISGTTATITISGGGGGSPGGSTTQVQYNDTGAFAGAAGFTFNGTSTVTLGVAGTSVGAVAFKNATSGTITLQPVTGALGTVTLSLPAATDTLVGIAATQTLTNKTLTTPTIGDFTNATHTHANSAGGGTLAASVIASGQLATARGGTGLDTSGSTGYPSLSAGTWSVVSATTLTAALNAVVGDSGAGGTKGLVPAPAAGDAAASKYLKADGTWATVSGGGGSPGGSGSEIQYRSGASTFGAVTGSSVSGANVAFAPDATTGNGLAVAGSAITTGNLVSIAATGTAAASNTKTALNVATSGANATSTQTTYGAQISNTSTGTSSTNVGLAVGASGGTNNAGLRVVSGTTTQTFQVYETFTDESNYSRVYLARSGNYFNLYTQSAGTGTLRGLDLGVGTSGGGLTLYTDGRAILGKVGVHNAAGIDASGNFAVNGSFRLGFASGDPSNTSLDTILRRAAAANLALGATDAAAPVAQTLSVQSVVGGTSNTAGANWTFAASRGTGTGTGGDLIYQTAPAGSTGTTQNSLVTAFTIKGDGAVQLKSVTFANLPTVANAYLIYCSDCTIASPCASGGSGALAKGINGAWVCN